jgi:CheY-like chemotaxis protein
MTQENCGVVTVSSAEPISGCDERATPLASDAGGQKLKCGAGQRVLFVDDEASLAKLGQRMLERLGYQAECFTDAVRALAVLRSEPDRYSAMITDLSMPVLSGQELAQTALESAPRLPIILMSGYAPAQARTRALEVGVREVILKPVSLELLGAALARALGAAGT